MTEKGFRADAINIDMVTVNRQFISVYKKYIIEIAVTDINNITKFFNILFIITDVKRYKAILNYL